MREILRRVILAVSLFTAIFLNVYQPGGLVSLTFERDQYRRPAGAAVVPPGPPADAFAMAVQALGGEPTTLAVTGTGRSRRVWLPADDPLAAACAALPEEMRTVQAPGSPERLVLTRHPRASQPYDAPAHLRHPWRGAAALILAAGLLVYVAIPWRRVTPDRVMYGRFRGAVLPDVLGVILGAGPYALVLAVVTYDSTMCRVLEAGYQGPLQVALLSSVFGWVIWAISARTASFAITIRPDGLLIETWRGARALPYSAIAALEPAHYETPAWLKALAVLGALARPRHTGSMILLATEEHEGLTLVPREGPPIRFWLTALHGADRLLAALRAAGVATDVRRAA